ncbi:DUF29 domain-containing protein [Scytonema millei]|uniref:DUF29 domain-containing protein n=1 Tax=Scytonema millei VB511283 TaxID=1245923 RepID=A0A9X5E8L6_9CYAN|nr:DUF29 domain-containing protein [Scytonema millei]NHC36906.1 DUF29 domain-containing protein [Scytonema millei VB511283]
MTSLYDSDFSQWIQTTADYLKQRQFDLVDWDNLIEELEGLGRAEKQEINRRLVVLLTNLLKWEKQVEYQCRKWRAFIRIARRDLKQVLDDSPSLTGDFLLELLPEAYEEAREKASQESTVFLENFPVECPYTIEQILDEGWLPG